MSQQQTPEYRSASQTRPVAAGKADRSRQRYGAQPLLFGLVSALALLEMFDLISGAGLYLWPTVLLLSVLFPPLRILASGGLGEILALATGMTTLRAVLPLALMGSGALLLRRAAKQPAFFQSSERHLHRIGWTFVLAGAARGIAVLSGIYKGTVCLGWIILMTALAVQFVIYARIEEID